MTRSTGRDRWSWSTGERGSNRVRVFEHPKSGRLFLEWFEPVAGARPKARTMALGHTDRDRAKGDAEAWALKLRRGEVPRLTMEPSPLDVPTLERPIRLGPLFDIYLREVTPRKKRHDHDKVTAGLMVGLWGRHKLVESLCERDWLRYIDLRRSGRLAPAGREGRPVRNRVLECDCRFLLAVLNWATRQKDAAGHFWLVANPLRGQAVPVEKNPNQPVITAAQYAALLKVAPAVSPRFEVALVLCHETGHRINSVRQLRWADVDLEARTVRWRAETDKSGKLHVTPLSDAAVEALQAARRRESRIGDGWVFPSNRGDQPLTSSRFQTWWASAANKAELTLPPGCRFHAFRRKMASELATEQLAVIKALGGWSAPHVVVSRYQKVPLEVQRDVMQRRRTG